MKRDYVLITPVHNEEEFIEETINSIVSQSILPVKWLIVDDASEDRTPRIIKECQQQYDFIEYFRLERGDVISYYSRRSYVFLAGYEKIKHLEFDFIAALDADIILGPEYYESVLKEFEANPQLGLASGVYLDKVDGKLMKVLIDENHCPGGIHVFRKQCYENVGGYLPLKYGGDDTCAEITARMEGWQTRSFECYKTIHLRPVGTGNGKSIYHARFRQGLTEYGVGSSPLFVFAKLLRRGFLERPFIFGSMARLAGFVSGYLRRERRQIPDTLVKYVRKEQLSRLFALANRK